MTAGNANDRLEGAFLQLIEEKPYAKITVNHIVERAGVHRNTFYYHHSHFQQTTLQMLWHIQAGIEALIPYPLGLCSNESTISFTVLANCCSPHCSFTYR